MSKFYGSTIQKGSQGNDVKQWQDFLRSNGFSVSVDGIFGDETETATKEWQTRNGLGVDGIVGEQTWGKAGYSNANNSVSAPNTNPLPTNPTYDTTSYDSTQKGKDTLGSYNSAKDAVNSYGDYVMGEDAQAAADARDAHIANKPGEYQSQWQSQLDQLMNSIMNREKFSYDLNSDALYQQYKDKYIQQGKLAMSDAIGQASAMTGGYGNSYAQAVGQQQYQASLDNLNDIVPELYAMALEQYNREGQDLYNQYGMVADRENLDYGRYRDEVSDYNTMLDYLTGRADSERAFDYTLHQDGYQKLLDSLGIASDDYYKGADMFYTEQNNKNSVAGQEFSDSMSIWNAETDQAWKQAQWDEAARQYAIDAKNNNIANIVKNSGGGKVVVDEDGNISVEPEDTTPTKVIDAVKNYTTQKGQADYLANQVSAGNITEDQAMKLLDQYGVVPLTERNWEMVDDGDVNWLWGVDNDAVVRDENGKEYTLKELKKELEKTMTSAEAKKYIKNLQKQLGI